MKKTLIGLFIGLGAVLLMGGVGDVFKSVMTDPSGNVINTPLTFSNQVSMTVAATNINQLVRYQEFTNTISGAINNATTNYFPVLGFTNSTLLGDVAKDGLSWQYTGTIAAFDLGISNSQKWTMSDQSGGSRVERFRFGLNNGSLEVLSVTNGSFIAPSIVMGLTADTAAGFIRESRTAANSDALYLQTFDNSGASTPNRVIITTSVAANPDDANVIVNRASLIVSPAHGTNTVPFQVYGATNQALALSQWLNSSSNVLLSVSSNGNVVGNGNGLTNLNASNLASGTIPTARYGSEVVQTNRTINTTAPITGGGNLSADRTFAYDGSVTHNESGATNFPSSQLTGTIPTARYGGEVVLTNTTQFISGFKTFTQTGAVAKVMYVVTTVDTAGNGISNGTFNIIGNGTNVNPSITLTAVGSLGESYLTWLSPQLNTLRVGNGFQVMDGVGGNGIQNGTVLFNVNGNSGDGLIQFRTNVTGFGATMLMTNMGDIYGSGGIISNYTKVFLNTNGSAFAIGSAPGSFGSVKTNGVQRLVVSAGVTLTPAATTTAKIELWTKSQDNSVTNRYGPVESATNVGPTTVQLNGWVQPTYIFWFTNLSGGGSTATLITNNYHEIVE